MLDIRVGNGFDVHAFAEGNEITLCGLKIPFSKKLLGHSDADVGLHAITDALYGAIASGDIGTHFPPSDNAWKNAASEVFLKHAVQLVEELGFKINNIDCTIICEQPKIGPLSNQMKSSVSKIMDLDINRISIKLQHLKSWVLLVEKKELLPLPPLQFVNLNNLFPTFFYIGFLRPAPGTWGSLAGIISAYFLLGLTNFSTFCFLLILTIVFGFLTTKKYLENNPEKSDPSEVVIDEVIGQWITILPLVYVFNFVQTDNENLWIVWIWAFFSFRFFDIIKLGLVSWADNLKGALGVILDDIFAGIAAALTVIVLLLVI